MKRFMLVLPVLLWAACAPQANPVPSDPNPIWQAMGGALDLEPGEEARDPSIALGSDGNPVVVWSEAGNIYAKRWTDAGWERLGEALDVEPSHYAFRPALLIGADGAPVVSWQEASGSGRNIYAKRWDGEAWVSLGGALDEVANLDATSPSLSFAADQPMIAFREQPRENCVIYVKRWTGSNWERLGAPVNVDPAMNACRPSLATQGSESVVAWYEWDGTSNNIHVGRWTGSDWQRLGGPLDVTLYQGAYNPWLALDASGHPVVAWREYDGRADKVFVKRWTGATWVQLGGALNVYTDGAAELPIIATAGSEIAVAWQERSGNAFNIVVRRWTGDRWQTLADCLNLRPGSSAYNVSLALGPEGWPVVAWEEVAGTSHDVYVKRYAGPGW